LISRAARVVIAAESDLDLPAAPEAATAWFSNHFSLPPGMLQVFGTEQWSAPVASGSSPPAAMVICPCSMGMVSAIASGASDNLMERAADVMIKERRPLILVPRESPFSAIHLENMLKLARLGVTILPANPGFYHHPRSVQDLVDHVVGRILDHLQIEHHLVSRWGYGDGE
ncbi:MAG TPA: UbiX family flavin prenyltransferase, partial [Gammaproteobacteria bacterium]|nr:UbiX family flavin prenyltransferase [Gammaproteobacteria bacterium]